MSELARAEAAILAETLPPILLEARRLAAAAPGVHGRRRPGQGEAFWQFRDHRPEDGAKLVDWRRSARGERLYVREREREAAQMAVFWLDPDPGFGWSSHSAWPAKRARALMLCLAFASLVSRAGERVGALGGQQMRAGPHAMERLALDLTQTQAPAEPPPPPARAAAIYASDFYAPLETWRARLSLAAALGANLALLVVFDPAEEDFPFRGRTLFERPGGGQQVLIGRAESAREAFAARLAEHRAGLANLAADLGAPLIAHRTDQPPGPALLALASALEQVD